MRMPGPHDFPAKGKVLRADGDSVVFAPAGTTYQLQLTRAGYGGPLNEPVRALLRARARKVLTVPSGGNFINPIVGTPRIIQGWVLSGDARQLVVHAGAPFIVELPESEAAIELTEGPIAANRLVNIVLLPGATLELASDPVAST